MARLRANFIIMRAVKGIYVSDLAEKVGISRNKLAGLFGATGRWEANTPGWPSNVRMANAEWDADKRERRYWLHPLVREVLAAGRVKL
jgi:hypothetical protein